MKYIFIILFAYAVSTSQVSAAVKYDISLKLSPTTWSGSNEDAGGDFNSSTTQITLGFGIQNDRLYGRLSLRGGTFSFTDSAPAQEFKTARVLTPNVDIEHGETDLIIGYYFWQQISVFADYKSFKNVWKNSDYEMSYSGLGVGVSGFHPLNQAWTFYGSVGFLFPYSIESNAGNIGDGNGSSLDLGFSYRWITHAQVSLGLKTQTQRLDFDNGNQQSHNRGELYVGIQYQF